MKNANFKIIIGSVILTIVSISNCYSQQAEVVGWCVEFEHYMPATGTWFTAINPVLENASDNSGSWEIDAEVFDLSSGANILHNYYPLSGPDPYLPHQLSVEFPGSAGWTGKVTFTITYSGIITSQETYSVGSYGDPGPGNC